MNYEINLVPAYGRDYRSPEEVKADWVKGKDFQIQDIGSTYNGAYTSIRDWRSNQHVRIRYNRRTEFVILPGLSATIQKEPR